MRILSLREAPETEIAGAMQRPVQDLRPYREKVAPVIDAVRKRGDAAVLEYTNMFDKVELANVRVPIATIRSAQERIAPALFMSIQAAAERITRFHAQCSAIPPPIEIEKGVWCSREVRPLDSVGLYVPGGTAPLFSTALMLGIPARIAQVPRIVLCSPPQKDGKVTDAILAVCALLSIDDVYAIGGAQAIAAMAYGTETVPKVEKICGPGSAYVTAAKAEVSIDPEGAAIDMLAGPSEILIIADDTANPAWVAADLLSQAEHDTASQVMLFTTSKQLREAVQQEIVRQLPNLSRKDIASKCLETSTMILTTSIAEALELSNRYAPEHLSLQIENPRVWLPKVRNAGSVFLGPFAAEVYGDYTAGPNHVLPTMGLARSRGGLSTADFQKVITVQELSREGAKRLQATAATLARAEGLEAHARAADIRFLSPS